MIPPIIAAAKFPPHSPPQSNLEVEIKTNNTVQKYHAILFKNAPIKDPVNILPRISILSPTKKESFPLSINLRFVGNDDAIHITIINSYLSEYSIPVISLKTADLWNNKPCYNYVS